ncbi:MAG: NUDIX domain-containing protein, partial [Caldilineaceae bacterium]|nr:NUDIX domain-containing protein [Caldilineaceae bacterium]
AARREAHEEAGVTVTGELRLHGMYWSLQEGKNDHIGVFVSTDFSIGEALDRWEIADCRWFPVDAPPAELSPACARRLAELRRGEGPYVDQW